MKHRLTLEHPRLPLLLDNIPILFEDDGWEDVGENNIHFRSDDIIYNGIFAFLQETRPALQVFTNLNLHYREDPLSETTGAKPYVVPDVMVVEADELLPEFVPSYTIGEQGPAPLVTVETLSRSTADTRDLRDKPIVFALLGIPEYILVDPTGEELPERLLLKRLQPDRTWKDEQDPDGGITSQLGFRIIWDEDGRLRVVNAATGWRYPRPDEANAEMKARLAAEERAQDEEHARRQSERARKIAEERSRAEADARRQAEERSRAEADARRQAEERIRILEAELARVHDRKPDSHTK